MIEGGRRKREKVDERQGDEWRCKGERVKERKGGLKRGKVDERQRDEEMKEKRTGRWRCK